jgi:hypothetical protein
MRYVNVYSVTQAYGGPEEGGWWYSHYAPIKSVAARTMRLAKKRLKEIKPQFSNPNQYGKILYASPDCLDSVDDIEPNDMSGIVTGENIEIFIQSHKAQHTPRPYYC